jgi:hypothetical protein
VNPAKHQQIWRFAPLVALAFGALLWIAYRGFTAPRSAALASASAPRPSAAPSGSSYPPPQLDLPASRLHERVNGAEPVLRAAGCRRLLYWRIEQPPADLELLVFAEAAGATQWLERDAASDRTQGVPGDEGWMNNQVLYFRKGPLYVRLIADQAVDTKALLAQGTKLAQAISQGELRP